MSKRARRRTAAKPAPAPPVGGLPAPGRTAFVATIGLSAFAMFTLELLGRRLVLPVFGGSASVWTTALVLFTGLLFVGYLYAHVVATHLTPQTGGALHLTLAIVATVLFAIGPSDVAALRQPGMPEALNVILALLLIAGAPMLVFASTTPLLSAWYARRGNDPWWLHAVSNLASLAALFVYPFLNTSAPRSGAVDEGGGGAGHPGGLPPPIAPLGGADRRRRASRRWLLRCLPR